MKLRLLLAFLILVLCMVSLAGCGKTSEQELAEKKAKDLGQGTGQFKPTPRKSY
ncbi:hypothetical protein [Geomonas azotofigens]|uniref:hypothetical protein n=1 Tax=Geomonas azotofigens TaxID=2843196 RepID=UPI001C1154BE|nr:hypothetical protein [Geomonas azotofigens]MBU5612649.1 hypothetical protein [Geomonas azotofigens]